MSHVTTHYRKLTSSELEDLKAELATDVDGEAVQPSTYDTLASFGGVSVGVDGNGAHIVQVLGGADAELPGTHAGDTTADLTDAQQAAVLRARIEVEETDPETGETVTVTKQVPEREVPDGATVLERGINPHQFAGA